jgi:hypothetical protein
MNLFIGRGIVVQGFLNESTFMFSPPMLIIYYPMFILSCPDGGPIDWFKSPELALRGSAILKGVCPATS